jgi:hypothetical protein
MVKKLLTNRGDDHLPYSLTVFREAFEDSFEVEQEKQLYNGRILFVYKNKVDL